MRREDNLPSIFSQYQNVVHYIQNVGHSKWTSNCPVCQGEPHADGELPNRCVWFYDSKPLGYCFKCGKTFFPDSAPDWTPPSPAEMEQWKREREAEQEARLRSAQQALDNLRSNRLWEQYADMAGERGRTYWESCGVPLVYQKFWSLGWDFNEGRWGCQSATIPLFNQSWESLNIKHRLTDDSKGRYRYNIAGQDAPMFLCDPDASLENHVIACEGEKKAAVVYITLDDPDAVVVGIPGLSPSSAITDTLAKAERVTLILDPDADTPGKDGWSPMGRLVRDIGRGKCRVLVPCAKVDDILIAMNATKWDAQQMLRQAVTI